jgi:hypothetical protein
VNTPSGSSDGWLKDFVEHLRTVHFAVTALAATLMVLAAPPDAKKSRALSQAARILEVSTDWGSARSMMVDLAARRLSLTTNDEHFVWVESLDAARYAFKSFISLSVLTAPTQEQAPHVLPGRRMDSPPRTINEFTHWWNRIATEGIDVNVINLIDAPTACEAWLEPVHPYEGQPVNREGLDCQERARDHGQIGAAPTMQMMLQVDYDSPAGPGFNVLLWQKQSVLISLTGEGPPMERHLYVREIRGVKTVHMGIEAARELFSGQRIQPGRFDEAFSELASMAPELGFVTLPEAVSRLRDIQPRSEQYVEIVGLKIPTDDLVLWGSGLLLAFQFYLWLHLSELSRRLQSNSVGSEVAWIGIYCSRWAFTAIVGSAFALPIASYYSLWLRAPAGFNMPNVCAPIALLSGVWLGAMSLRRVRFVRSRLKF